ncbi:hypothetical protein ACFLVR_04505 [Chloroflexota bacterium]
MALILAFLMSASVRVEAIEQSFKASIEINAITNTSISDNGPAGWSFADLLPGTIDIDEEGQFSNNGAFTLLVGVENNVRVDLRVKADNFEANDISTSYIIPVENLKFGITYDNEGAASLTQEYSDTLEILSPGANLDIWMWLSIPDHQESGNYSTTLYISTDRWI